MRCFSAFFILFAKWSFFKDTEAEKASNAHKKMTKKTRTYVVDGVQVTSTTYHVMAEDGTRNYKAKEDFNLRYKNKIFRSFLFFLSFVFLALILASRNYYGGKIYVCFLLFCVLST